MIMSLYNALHGVNPLAGLLLGFVGISTNDIPRFRDCYITENGEIAIHTRTGGGNRAYYESEAERRSNYPEDFEGGEAPDGPWNCDLRKIAGFIRDEDDSFDSTYATFYYEPTEDIAPLIKQLQEIVTTETPGEKWQKLFADMEAHRDTPRVARALEVGKPLIDAINHALKDD